SPIVRAAQRVTLLVAELARSRIREDRQVVRVAIVRQIGFRIAIDIRTTRACINIGASVVTEAVGQTTLDRGVRVELPTANDQIGCQRDATEESLAFANRQLPHLREDKVVLPLPVCHGAVKIGVEEEVLGAIL